MARATTEAELIARTHERIRLRRRTTGVAVVLLIVLAGGLVVGTTAWIESPTPSALGAHVQARLRGTGGKIVGRAAVSTVLREAVVATDAEDQKREPDEGRHRTRRSVLIVRAFHAV